MRLIFYLFTKIIEMVFKIISIILFFICNILFKNGKKYRELRVKNLDKIRKRKGYRNEWLYHKCKEENLLTEYNKIIKPEINKLTKDYTKDDRVKMSFGKYKGIPIDEVWKNDRNYLVHAYGEGWLDNKNEGNWLGDIFFEENISYTKVR
jgi:hypothetical protein